MSLRIDQVGGDAGLSERDLADLVALRLAWKPAASADDDAAFVDGFRDWWGSEGDRRRGWLARHTSGYAVGMANAAVFTRMPVPARGARWLYVANVFVRPESRRAGAGRGLREARPSAPSDVRLQ